MSAMLFGWNVLAVPSVDAQASQQERWDRRYAGEDYVYGSEPSPFLRRVVDRLGSGKALVLAMGEGRNAVFLAQSGFSVTGVDLSPVAVKQAAALAAERGVAVEGVAADLRTYDLGNESWDLITDFYFLDRDLFPEIIAALAPGGYFVLETFSLDHPQVGSFGPRNPDFLLAPNELLRLLEPLRVLLYEDLVVEVDEGMHQGPAALVRVIAQKPPA